MRNETFQPALLPEQMGIEYPAECNCHEQCRQGKAKGSRSLIKKIQHRKTSAPVVPLSLQQT